MSAPTARNVPALLQTLREQGFTGTVRVSGTPGGTIHLRGGLVGAIETPGAPTATSALLTTGRVDDQAWLTACATEPDADRVGAHLVSAGLIGAAELEIVCTAAVFDGAFAMALGPAGSWETADREPTLLAPPGVEPRALTEEVTRRTALLGRAGATPGELARLRPEPAADRGPGEPGQDDPGIAAPGDRRPGTRLSPRYRELLGQVNGRRTPRDLAFALGRGLYAVMLDLNRLESLGLIRWETRTTTADRPSTAPRVLPGSPATGPAPAGGPLPRRRPGAGSSARHRGEREERGGG
ncbi:hypothetical protein TUSST3_87980 [Streptomyces sp. TUS-ST3]|uniref:hypothetical protein n=1 Tax=Streptomyces sp. TUS-ST3 TaxID=3025591 RepID=UPI00235B4AEB|nr:hypothetical protein [Streptomyces sp. TUS-ST3]GLP72180.1 hypothetical protein TUSST3_87980 [Streptomyces sp. TUS-ST3]